MKRMVLAALFGVAASSSAMAADMGYTSSGSAAIDWSGFYAGVFAGYGFGNTDITDNVAALTASVNNTDGLLAGVTVGGNMQYDKFVVGLEGDIAWSGQQGSVACPGGALTCKSDYDWTGSLRGRIGYAIDPVLLYATGGLAVARVNASIVPGGSDSSTYAGWTVGGGVEAAIAKEVSVKLEYDYADYGSKTVPAGVLGGNAGTVAPTSHTVKFGLNYHF